MRSFCLLLFILIFSAFSFAQQDSLVLKYDDSNLKVQEISLDDLADYKAQKAFNYSETESKNTILDNIYNWLYNVLLKMLEAVFGVGHATGIVKFILKFMPYLLLGVLVFILIKFFLKVSSRNIIQNPPKKASIQFTEDEIIIKDKDIQTLIDQAITESNYRLAIRYLYLLALRQLDESKRISWEQQKTNEDYIKELKAHIVKNQFITITRIYDYVWYGEFPIDALKFETLRPAFSNLIKSV
ncbi:DUF4129 domain-containing protein [Snuella sedimenti]|uniref:DUF4129 domain-containing protein n=1 Tax=Snuella sedimenti TaxID=2798802 RepID=A0A8J7J4D6_9FLAO|nr:DUF4129 domain-containing protein [Snuella sedimenti]MBJ6368489.1 DUF4129 domain-containing protein [Snuella sedimenti]